MAFRKKAGLILSYQPDILVIPECEHPDKLKFMEGIPKPTDIFMVRYQCPIKRFEYSLIASFRFKLHKTYNPSIKMVIPVTVTGGDLKLMLYAIWANLPDDPDGQYVEQVWKAIHSYDKHIRISKPSWLVILIAIHFETEVQDWRSLSCCKTIRRKRSL